MKERTDNQAKEQSTFGLKLHKKQKLFGSPLPTCFDDNQYHSQIGLQVSEGSFCKKKFRTENTEPSRVMCVAKEIAKLSRDLTTSTSFRLDCYYIWFCS